MGRGCESSFLLISVILGRLKEYMRDEIFFSTLVPLMLYFQFSNNYCKYSSLLRHGHLMSLPLQPLHSLGEVIKARLGRDSFNCNQRSCFFLLLFFYYPIMTNSRLDFFFFSSDLMKNFMWWRIPSCTSNCRAVRLLHLL